MKKILFITLVSFSIFILGCDKVLSEIDEISYDEVISENDNEKINENDNEKINEEINKEDNEISEYIKKCIEERKNKNYQEALKIANKIIELDKNNSVGYCELARTYYDIRQNDKAKEYVQKAIKINPKDTVAKKLLTQIEKEPGFDEKDLVEVLDKCVEEREKKNYKESLKLANKIIELDKKSSIGYCELGRTYYEMGQLDKAKKYIEKALKINPKDDVANGVLSQIERGPLEESNALFEVLNKCVEEREKKNYQEALKFAKKIIELDKEGSIGYTELSKTYYEMGQKDKAKEYIEKALKINPNDNIAKEFLKEITK